MRKLCDQLEHTMEVLFEDETLYAARCAQCGYRCGTVNQPASEAAIEYMETSMFMSIPVKVATP